MRSVHIPLHTKGNMGRWAQIDSSPSLPIPCELKVLTAGGCSRFYTQFVVFCDAPTHRILKCIKCLHGLKKKLDKTREEKCIKGCLIHRNYL